MSSTTISTDGSATSDFQSVVKISESTWEVVERTFARSRTRIFAMYKETPPPVRLVMRSLLRCKVFQTPEPTVPNPAKPIPSEEQEVTGQTLEINESLVQVGKNQVAVTQG
jgi:hypothetical protein